jgi:hypothetical protein
LHIPSTLTAFAVLFQLNFKLATAHAASRSTEDARSIDVEPLIEIHLRPCDHELETRFV